ncbi:activator of Hsp90 ATPase [Mycena amicta]|nr:activator of Hsp90 ATPase [Mycena amicta]
MAIPAPLTPGIANWHWKSKTVTPWGKEWFERELPTLTVSGEGVEIVGISSVTDVDGDIELGQRKSKLITIFDCKIVLAWSGTASDGTEVSHETTVDHSNDYAYHWSLTTSSSPEVDTLFKLAKSRLPAALETKFTEFAVALVETHSKDVTASSADPSRSGTPAPAPTASTSEKKTSKINTTKVTVEGSFMASADDLFNLLTDEKRIPTWTRAPAQVGPFLLNSSSLLNYTNHSLLRKPDTEYSLFGGGVKGKYVSLPWALQSPTWPSDHTATLTTTIAQSSDYSTVTFVLAGVPTGMEEEIKRNIEGYYIQGFKSIGLGSSLS